MGTRRPFMPFVSDGSRPPLWNYISISIATCLPSYVAGYEYKNGTALEAERQNEAYKNACSYGASKDGDDECYTDQPTRRRALLAN